ncbi:MAG: hypothetical protein Q4G65_14230 [bacterium]|nr:hypothetical protein [bacterium]
MRLSLLLAALLLLAGCAAQRSWNQKDQVDRARSTVDRVMWR